MDINNSEILEDFLMFIYITLVNEFYNRLGKCTLTY